MTVTGRGVPPAQLVRYNDWRQVELPPLREFRPEFPVSVIVPYYAQLEELGRTLAALEGQTWPRELFEVVVVDDGSPEPLAEVGRSLLERAPFAVRAVRQEDLGFGLARARNRGARAATHEVLVFLDADLLPEADWLMAHARWHHAAPDVVTLGAAGACVGRRTGRRGESGSARGRSRNCSPGARSTSWTDDGGRAICGRPTS